MNKGTYNSTQNVSASAGWKNLKRLSHEIVITKERAVSSMVDVSTLYIKCNKK
jgi:hypothetical protein